MGERVADMQPRGGLVPRAVDERGRVDLRGFDLPGMRAFAQAAGVGATQATRVFQALWREGVAGVLDVEGVTRSALDALDAVAFVSDLHPVAAVPAADGTTKLLWRLYDGAVIESVLIPDGDRLTLCVSSQVGCAMACAFCVTGDMGLTRHLSAGEVALQPLRARAFAPGGQRITNLVLMGMGEPLHNLDNLVRALTICMDDRGLNLSHRKITVSTVGLAPQLRALAERLPVNLAVSLNASTEEQRRALMPITRKHSLAELVAVCRDLPLPSNKRITFEYVMFDGVNDADADAQRLVALLHGVPTKVNLIPYNPNPRRALRPPPPERVKAFQHYLVSHGVNCTIRATRGQDVSAACGQLGRAWQERAGLAAEGP